jgi:glycosyltransferase involved in cell wall biosynthesis
MATKTKKDLKKLLNIVEKRKIPKLNPGLKLSLCMIVKNESKYLGNCLASVEGVVDEIIVVDTGSTDDTVEIAEKYGARVFHYKWHDDFGAARNESLKHATGDWILVLDADEVLSEDSRDKIRAFMVDVGDDIYYQLRIKNLGANNKVAHQNYMIRFFKNNPGARYIGRIHEYIVPPSGYINISDKDIQIIHHGYKENFSAKVTGRNLPILESILKDDNVVESYKSFVNYYIGSSQLDLGKLDEAVTYLNLSIEQLKNEEKMPLFAVHTYFRLMNTYVVMNNLPALEKLLAESREDCKILLNTFEYWFYCAYADIKNKKYEDALENLFKVLEIYNDKSKEYFRLATEPSLYFFSLYYMADIFIQLNDIGNAIKFLDRAYSEAKENFDYPNYKISLVKLLLEIQQYDKAIQICQDLVESTEGKSQKEVATYLSNIYLKTNQFDKAVKLQATVHDPDVVKDNWYSLTTSLEDEKFFPAAELVYSAILDVLPEEVQSYLGRAVSRLVQNKTIDALSDMAMAKKLAGKIEDKTKLALLYLQIGQSVQAKSIFDEILKEAPEDYQTNLYMAGTEQSEGKIQEAEDRLSRLTNLFPEDVQAYVQLGNLLLSNQKIDEAIEVFEKANGKDPSNAYVLYALGISHLERNEKEKALRYIENVIELEPENEEMKNLHKMVSVS